MTDLEEEMDAEVTMLTQGQGRDQTFEANLGLATWVALRFGHSVLPRLDDRIQAARIGLWKAILHHDPTKAKLTTFAVRVMINEIVRVGERERNIHAERYAPREMPDHRIRIEDVLSAIRDPSPDPEQRMLQREKQNALSAYAGSVKRQRRYRGATWTASDVAALIDAGNRPAEVARMLGVTRERIRQILNAIRAERTKQEGGQAK